MKNFYILLLIALPVFSVFAQNNNTNNEGIPLWYELMQDPNANFYDAQNTFNSYYANKKRTKGDGYKIFKRWEYYMQSRVSETGEKPNPAQNWTQYNNMISSNNPPLSPSGQWTEIGPISLPTNGTGQPNGLGRVNALAFHPTNSNIIWAGAPSGGLWKTTDGGSSWTTNTDNLATLGVSAILIDSSNTNIMYLGSGDRDGGDAPGLGVFKSTDGGFTWNQANNTMGNVTVNMMLIHPNNSSIIFAATSDGIYKSTNSASSWTKVSATANIKDIKFKPGNPATMYAASTATFYRSTNSGDSWSTVSSGLPSSGRFVIGVSAANSSYVYVVSGGSSGLIGIYRSTNSGQSFATRATSPNILGYSTTGTDNASQAYYDLCVAVDPTNINVLYVGGINIWKSTNGGSSWSLNAHWVGSGNVPAVHADIHTLDFAPDGTLYSGNDGGVYKTTNGGATWVDISSGLAIAQIYKIGQSQGTADQVINGYQDNGTSVYSESTNSWETVIGGDGMECIIDPADNTYKYGALYYGDIRRSVGGGYFYTIADNGTNGITESGAWVTPYTLAEHNENIMFIGYKNVWRSTNVKASTSGSVNWTSISSWGTTNLDEIEHSPFNNSHLYVSNSSTIRFTSNALSSNPSWTAYSAPGFVTDIEADSLGNVYITAGTNVFKTTNISQGWTNISGNLPNVNLNDLVIDKTTGDLYVGTDIGVFYKAYSSGNWVNFSSNLPAAAEVTELEIYYDGSSSKIRAATYGRGMWSSDLYSPGNVPPVADFDADITNPCIGQTVNFVDYSSNAPTSWQWTITPSTYNFTGGTSASSQNPQVQFNANGNYTITLVAGNAYGYDTITETNLISVQQSKTFTYSQNVESFVLGDFNNNDPGVLYDNWTRDDDGAFTWYVGSGTTPSSSTGPSVDNTLGTSSGKYLYTEASNPAATGEVARLVSPCIQIPNNSNASLSFYYHMYGSAIIGLYIDVYHNGSWSALDSIIGQKHSYSNSPWTNKTISLSAYINNTIKIRFKVERPGGSNYYMSDIAIDDIKFSLPGYPNADFTSSKTTACVGEIITLADQTSNTPNSWNWLITPNTFNFVNSTSASSQNPSIQFTDDGNYDVKLVVSNNTGTDSIIKNNFLNIIYGASLPMSENMETFTGGSNTFNNGWSQNVSSVNYQWYVNTGPTASTSTGPNVDHTLGTLSGKYIYAEASSPAVQGDEAHFESSCIDLSSVSNAYLKFWYHMYGVNIGSLEVDINYNGTWNNVYTLTGQQQTSNSAAWQQASINLSNYLGSSIKIRFSANRGGGFEGDIAIDDIIIESVTPPANDDPCGATLMTVATACSYSTYSNVLSTTSTGMQTPGCGSFSGEDVWFKMIVPSSGYVNVNSDVVNGSFTDGAMAAYTGSCTNLSYIECDDDDGTGNMPKLELSGLNPGDTLFIRFWEYGGGQTGQFKLCAFEPDYLDISPSNKNVSGAYGSTTFDIVSSTSWNLSDNVSWLTVTPTSGNGNQTVTATYSTNSSGTRTATLTVTSASMNATATLTQYSSTFADFNLSSTYVCVYDTIVFTNASVNANSYKWFVNSTQVGTANNLNYSFTNTGNYEIKLVAIGSSINDTIVKRVFVFDNPFANAGSDTTVCENSKVYLNAASSFGYYFCNSNCGMPSTYCVSASGNDNYEYISNVSLNGSVNQSSNGGNGYEDFTSDVLTVLTKDSSYTMNVAITVPSNTYLEYCDAFIDWNRNGIFDEPATSFGSASVTGSHTFNAVVTVPYTAVLGKTRMRVILKYNGSIASGCENYYQFGETEDYMIEINEVDEVNYNWLGASYSSNQRIDSVLNITTSQTGDFTLTVTDGLGCSNYDNKYVTVNSLPNITFNAINDVCVDASVINLNQASPAGGTYSGIGVNSGSFDPSVAGVGTHTITYSYTDANGCSNSATQTITVNDLPTVDIGSLPNNLCENTSGSITLTATPAGGTFSGNGINGNQFSPSTAGVGTHLITYNYTDNNGCSNTDISSIIVNPIAQTDAGSNQTISYGDTANLSGSVVNSSGFSYSWTPANKVINPTSLSTNTVDLYQTQYFYLTSTSATCSDYDSVKVTITGGPVGISISANQNAICEGESVQLNSLVSGGVGSNFTYTWSSIPSGFSSSSPNPTVNPTVTTDYICSVTDGTTADDDTVTITVYQNPTVTMSTPNDFCLNDQTDLYTYFTSLTSPAGGELYVDGILYSSGFTANQLGSGTHLVKYVYTNANLCSDSVTQSFNVNSLPQISITSLPSYCENDGLQQLNFAIPVGGSYSGNYVSANSFDVQSAGVGNHIITYSYTDANLCTNTLDTSITVYASPIANAGSNQIINTASSTQLNGSGSNGSGNYTYAWSPASLLSNANISNPTTSNLNSSVYFELLLSDQTSGCSDIDSVLITVSGGQLSLTAIANPQTICNGGSVSLVALGSGGSGNYNYNWTDEFGNSISTQPTAVVTPTQSTYYVIELSDGTPPTIIDTAFITVNPRPVVDLGNDTSLCDNQLFTLDAGSGYSSYNWSTGSTNQTIQINPNAIGSGVHNYFVNVMNSYGCTGSDTIQISTGLTPYINLGADDTLCFPNEVKYLDAGFGFQNYLWNTGDTVQIISVNSSDIGIGTYNYWVQVSNQLSCPASDTIIIVVDQCIGIEDGFDENRKISLYPNPSDDNVFVSLKGFKSEKVKIELFDNAGRILISKTITINSNEEKLELITNNFAKGVYNLRIETENREFNRKLILN